MITIQETALEAAHVQSRLVEIVSVPAPPDGGADCIELVTLTWHFDPDGPVTETAEDVHEMSSTAAIDNATYVARQYLAATTDEYC